MKDQQIAALKLELRTVNCYVKEMGELKQLNASREAQHASRIRELKEELRKKELEISDLREQTKQQETPRFLSLSAPVLSDTIKMYQSVIDQLNREILSLQRSQSELTAQLNASQSMSEVSQREVSEENWSCADQLKDVMETLQRSLHEKNEIVAHQNEQIRILISERDELRKRCDMLGMSRNINSGVDVGDDMKDIGNGDLICDTNSSETKSIQIPEVVNPEEYSRLQSELEKKSNQLHSLQDAHATLTSSIHQQNLLESKFLHTELNSLRSNLQEIHSELSSQQSSIISWLSKEVESLLNHYIILDDHHSEYRHQIALLRDEVQNYKGNYRVMIRTRPVLDLDKCSIPCITVENEFQIKITNDKEVSKSFTFDRVFASTSSQEDIYVEVEPVVMSIFRGLNACILAYGQTGSGKTYSMIGEPGRPGILSRSCHAIFEEFSYRKDEKFSLKVGL